MNVQVTFSLPGFSSAFTEELQVNSLDNSHIISEINKLVHTELNDDSINVKQILSVIHLP